MKREFPVLYKAASVWVATPLIGFSTVFYVNQAITQAANEVYPIGMAAFGVTAALSAICFTMVPICDNTWAARYAGEKFLHSSLLLIQTLLALYARDAGIVFFGAHTHPSVVIKGVADFVLSLVSAAAAWTWYWGFSALNAELWRNWERRIREFNNGVRASTNRGATAQELPRKPLEPTTKTGTEDNPPNWASSSGKRKPQIG